MTVAALIAAIVAILDIVDQVATQHFNDKASLEAYIAKRNDIRHKLVTMLTAAEAVVSQAATAPATSTAAPTTPAV